MIKETVFESKIEEEKEIKIVRKREREEREKENTKRVTKDIILVTHLMHTV